jgi:hypothetical protein
MDGTTEPTPTHVWIVEVLPFWEPAIRSRVFATKAAAKKQAKRWEKRYCRPDAYGLPAQNMVVTSRKKVR